MSVATTGTRTARGVSAPVLVGGAFLLTTVLNICFQVADIVFTDNDPAPARGSDREHRQHRVQAIKLSPCHAGPWCITPNA